jgi:hypothetical protein
MPTQSDGVVRAFAFSGTVDTRNLYIYVRRRTREGTVKR